MASVGTDSQPQSPDTELVVASVIFGVCFLVGAPGNLFVIWTILKHVKQRSHTVILILHLAVADLMVLITLPLWIYSFAHSWIFGLVTCKAVVYLVNACMYSSVFFITIMSVERFLAVRYPFASAGWRRKQALHKLLFGVWVAAFLFSIPVIRTQTLGDQSNHCTYKMYNSDTEEITFVLVQTIVGFVAPLTVLVVCYGCLYCRITQLKFKSKRKSTGLIAAVVVAFVICWPPHHIGNILTLIGIGIETSHKEVAEHLDEVRQTMMYILRRPWRLSAALLTQCYMSLLRGHFEVHCATRGYRSFSATSPAQLLVRGIKTYISHPRGRALTLSLHSVVQNQKLT